MTLPLPQYHPLALSICCQHIHSDVASGLSIQGASASWGGAAVGATSRNRFPSRLPQGNPNHSPVRRGGRARIPFTTAEQRTESPGCALWASVARRSRGSSQKLSVDFFRPSSYQQTCASGGLLLSKQHVASALSTPPVPALAAGSSLRGAGGSQTCSPSSCFCLPKFPFRQALEGFSSISGQFGQRSRSLLGSSLQAVNKCLLKAE